MHTRSKKNPIVSLLGVEIGILLFLINEGLNRVLMVLTVFHISQ